MTTAPTSQTMLFILALLMLVHAPVWLFGSSKSDEVENRDNDHDRADQPNDAVHFSSPCNVEKLNGCRCKRFQVIMF
jgi:hypothetical protein